MQQKHTLLIILLALVMTISVVPWLSWLKCLASKQEILVVPLVHWIKWLRLLVVDWKASVGVLYHHVICNEEESHCAVMHM